LGENQSTKYSGIPYLKISLNRVSYYSQCTIEPLYGKLIKEKPNKVNTFGADYHHEAMGSGLLEKTIPALLGTKVMGFMNSFLS